MVAWGVTKFLHKDLSWGNLDQFGQKELVHVGSLVSHASNFYGSQQGSRSHERKHRRRRSIWREELLLSLWFSLKNRQENVWRLLRQRKEIGARMGLHLVVCVYLIEVSRTLALPKKASSLLCVNLWWKAKAFCWGHELWNQTTLWNLSAIKMPTMGSTCLHWSLSNFLQRLLTSLEY